VNTIVTKHSDCKLVGTALVVLYPKSILVKVSFMGATLDYNVLFCKVAAIFAVYVGIKIFSLVIIVYGSKI
jgi:hypothetical protein